MGKKNRAHRSQNKLSLPGDAPDPSISPPHTPSLEQHGETTDSKHERSLGGATGSISYSRTIPNEPVRYAFEVDDFSKQTPEATPTGSSQPAPSEPSSSVTQSAEVSPQSIPPPPIEDSTLAASTSEEQSHKEDENPSEEPVADTETAREEPASTAGEITDNAVPIIEAPIIEKPDEAEATQQPEPGDTEEQSTESGVDAITEETAAVATSEDAEEGEGDGTIDAGSDEVEQEKREGEVHEPENAEQAKNTGASDKTNNDTPGMPEGGFDTEAEGLNTSGAPLAPSLDHADNADVVEATRPPASENEASKGDEIPSSSDVIVQHSLEERSIRFADDVRNPQPFATSYKTGRKKPSKVKSRTGDNKLSTTSANNDPPGEVERRGSSPSDLSHRNTTKLKCKGKNSTRVGKLENVANDGGKSENKAAGQDVPAKIEQNSEQHESTVASETQDTIEEEPKDNVTPTGDTETGIDETIEATPVVALEQTKEETPEGAPGVETVATDNSSEEAVAEQTCVEEETTAVQETETEESQPPAAGEEITIADPREEEATVDNVTLPDDVSEERDATPSSIEDTVPPTTEDPSEPLAESSTEPSVVNSTEASSVDSTCDQPQASSEPDLPTSGDVSKAEESSAEESTAEKSAAVDQDEEKTNKGDESNDKIEDVDATDLASSSTSNQPEEQEEREAEDSLDTKAPKDCMAEPVEDKSEGVSATNGPPQDDDKESTGEAQVSDDVQAESEPETKDEIQVEVEAIEVEAIEESSTCEDEDGNGESPKMVEEDSNTTEEGDLAIVSTTKDNSETTETLLPEKVEVTAEDDAKAPAQLSPQSDEKEDCAEPKDDKTEKLDEPTNGATADHEIDISVEPDLKQDDATDESPPLDVVAVEPAGVTKTEDDIAGVVANKDEDNDEEAVIADPDDKLTATEIIDADTGGQPQSPTKKSRRGSSHSGHWRRSRRKRSGSDELQHKRKDRPTEQRSSRKDFDDKRHHQKSISTKSSKSENTLENGRKVDERRRSENQDDRHKHSSRSSQKEKSYVDEERRRHRRSKDVQHAGKVLDDKKKTPDIAPELGPDSIVGTSRKAEHDAGTDRQSISAEAEAQEAPVRNEKQKAKADRDIDGEERRRRRKDSVHSHKAYRDSPHEYATSPKKSTKRSFFLPSLASPPRTKPMRESRGSSDRRVTGDPSTRRMPDSGDTDEGVLERTDAVISRSSRRRSELHDDEPRDERLRRRSTIDSPEHAQREHRRKRTSRTDGDPRAQKSEDARDRDQDESRRESTSRHGTSRSERARTGSGQKSTRSDYGRDNDGQAPLVAASKTLFAGIKRLLTS